jgi:SAM-dependent methyltransferase
MIMIQLKKWRKQTPSEPFKDYFAASVEAKLRGGKPHASSGGNLGWRVWRLGASHFKRLWIGLNPAMGVDYGCGTLRVGIHAITYLGKGAYWGLDISDFLLEEGRKLIGETLYREKQPHLRVISEASVAEAAAAKPALLFSEKVLIHVHPDDLLEYFRNVLRIIGVSGQAIIRGKWSDKRTIAYSSRSWAHSIYTIEELIKAQGGSLTIVKEERRKLSKRARPYDSVRYGHSAGGDAQ